MSDFGANTSDFDSDFRAELSDYASDFRAEGNDYARDFCDFPATLIATLEERYSIAVHGRKAWGGRPGSRIDRAAVDRQPPGGHKGGGKLSAQE